MNIRFIDQVDITHKKVLLRVDFNVSLNRDHTIADDYRIRQSIPTIKYLLKRKNIVYIVSHLGRPEKKDERFSLAPVVNYLKALFSSYEVTFLETIEKAKSIPSLPRKLYVLENIRFYKGEKKNDDALSKNLASIADIYVNDAFGVSHRENASIVGVTKYLPSYGGLLLKKELFMIDSVVKKPKHPVVAIIGGAKVSTKIKVMEKLMEIADYLLVGGGIANTFFAAEERPIGSSIYEKNEKKLAEKLVHIARKKQTKLVFPSDVVLGSVENGDESEAVSVDDISSSEKRAILDIGPQTQVEWGKIIGRAKTIIWNGPVGYIEKTVYARGTEFIYYAIAQNTSAVSVVGGGDTLVAISKKEYLEKITHVSTGGGAMLEYIEKGTLIGLEALSSS